ncbi:MAG: hypothetical protein ACJ8EK_19630 [Bradyrhizobium sp.]
MSLTRTLAFGAALLGVALSSSQSQAQEKSFTEMITGAWIITSVFDEYQNGEKKDNWGGPVKGQLTFGRTGRFTTIIIGPSVASMKTDDPRRPDALIVAYYGSMKQEKDKREDRVSELFPAGQHGYDLDRPGQRRQANLGRLSTERPTRDVYAET